MATHIIYSTTADGSAAGSSSTYSLARGSTAPTLSTSSTLEVANDFNGTTYRCGQSFLIFDTSAVPAGGGTGTFSLNVSNFIGNAISDTVLFRQVSSTAAKIAGASLGAQTPVWSNPGTFPTGNGVYTSSISSSIYSLPRSVTFNVVLHTAGEQAGTVPTGRTIFQFSSADTTGTTNDPFLQLEVGSLWDFVGVSNEVAVATTAHALVTTGIGGTLQAGDLLVACITSRIASTTSITLPTGGAWTLVAEQKNNNTATNTTAAASGLMAYCVRGASNPNLTFTHPVAPSQAQGRIVAYRNVNTTSPKDTQTSFTTTSVTAVSGTGLTTTQIEDLIVAMACGGQEAAWSAFNATDPAGASGATDTTSAPTTTWIERADSAVITGADGSLAIFDAVKLTSGATGSLTATASLQALHVVIAGAFKITARIADAWNVEDKGTGISLSNSDKTASVTIASGYGVRSTTKRTNGTAGKYYAEFLNVTTVGGSTCYFGIQPTSATLTNLSAGFRCGASGAIVVAGSTVGNIGTLADNDIICIAWDSGAELVWFRRNNGDWNNSGTANPATGTGGFDASFAAATEHALWYYGAAVGQGTTLRTEVADFTYYGPVGFTSWMGEALPAAPAGDGVGSASGTGAASAQGAAFALAAGTGTATGATSATGVTLAIAIASGTATGATSAVGESIIIAAGTGAATGTGTASATGALIGTGAGTAAGIGAAAATAVTIGTGVGTAAGTGTATGTGSTTTVVVAGDGTSAGTGAASATGTGLKAANASVAAGTSTAAGTSAVTLAIVGSAAGVGAATGTASATGTGAGTAPGTSTANATGRLTGAGNGSAAGIGAAAATATVMAASAGTAAGTGFAISLSDPGTTTGTATGVGTANAAGVRITASVASAAGAGAASATGALVGAGAGSAVGIGAAAATGRGVASAAGAASGTGTATATAEGGLTVSATGSAAGTSAANATGVRFLAGAGTATGLGTATATGRAIATAAGSAACVSTALAAGAATGTAIGLAAGTGEGTGRGVGVVTSETVGTAVGTGTATGVGFAILPSAIAVQRIIVLAAEDRTIEAAAEHRTITATVESRTIVAVAEDRTIIATIEDRDIETAEASMSIAA